MFLHVSVYPWGSTWAGTPPGQVPPGQVHTHTLGRYIPLAGTPPWTGTPPRHNARWVTVNKRAVRIPLECILDLIYLS